MLRIYDGGYSTLLLTLCYGMDGQGSFSGGFRSVNFYYPAFGTAVNTQSFMIVPLP
jgi:hypothetical protein